MRIFILLWASLLTAGAETIWVAQTAAGADDGSSAANAHSAAWFNTAGNWGVDAGDISPGDTVMLSGTITTALTVQASGSSGNFITIQFDTGAKISGATWNTTGALIASSKNYINIIAGTIESTANGGALANQNNDRHIVLTSCNDWLISGVTSANSYVPNPSGSDSNAYGAAIYATTCNRLTLSNNLFHTGAKLVQINYNNTGDFLAVSNTITNCVVGLTLGSATTSATHVGGQIIGNTINNGTNWWGSWAGGTVWHHIDCIHAFAAHTGSVISNLTIAWNDVGPHNPTYSAGSTATAWIYVEANVGEIYSPVIRSNVFRSVGTSGQGPSVGLLALKNNTTPSVRHNTFSGGGTLSAIYLYATTSDAVIENNIFSDMALGIYDDSSSPGPTLENNLYFSNTSCGRIASTSYSTLANWQTGLGGCPGAGNDCDGVSGDPLFVSSSDLRLQAGSPAIGAALGGGDIGAYSFSDGYTPTIVTNNASGVRLRGWRGF